MNDSSLCRCWRWWWKGWIVCLWGWTWMGSGPRWSSLLIMLPPWPKRCWLKVGKPRLMKLKSIKVLTQLAALPFVCPLLLMFSFSKEVCIDHLSQVADSSESKPQWATFDAEQAASWHHSCPTWFESFCPRGFCTQCATLPNNSRMPHGPPASFLLFSLRSQSASIVSGRTGDAAAQAV